jgi:DNA-binding IclR family transcriptional regulator
MAQPASIEVIRRTAAILRCCRDASTGLSLGDISKAVGLPRSTVQRIVQALIGEELLTSNGKAGSICLGPEALSLTSVHQLDVMEVAQPHLKHLSDVTGETVDLSRLQRDHLIFVNQIAGTHRLRAVSSVGENFPLMTTANGRAVLAMMTERELAASRVMLAPLSRRRHLQQMLAAVRTRGYALDENEHTDGISAIGVAFRDKSSILHAISIPVPTVRFKARRAVFARELMRTQADILAEM